ncbi:fimbrial protein [Enterobacter kobei]|uniref:fimbrial protein n=1 Tax=Enterobacter kobei TaxID=208224 RepID=UPI0020045148|nr:type 1 fimbrial protein [Enterobacter kobei]MCK7347720.1 type 1 fimbrial protein [Enterobacter kobei]
MQVLRFFFWFKKRNLSILFLYSSMAMASTHGSSGHGNSLVKLTGSIVDTPCSIAVADSSQIISLDVESLKEINRSGEGKEKKFLIHLINCVLDDGKHSWDRFHITFDGASHLNNIFEVNGGNPDEGIYIKDLHGNISTPGRPMPDGNLNTGTMTLVYYMNLTSVSKHFSVGRYNTAIRFHMNYD